MSKISAFEAMASDIGVRRCAGESDMSFCTRTAYSASRYWASAFCMDDGQDGSRGVTSQVLSKRLSRWITSLDHVMPNLGGWFEANGKRDVKAIYGRLIDAGDILLAGEEGRCVARSAMLEPITADAALALGFFEPATADFADSMVTSGLGAFVPGNFEAPTPRAPWWETDCLFMAWGRASDYGELQYVNPRSRRWGLVNSDSWTEEHLCDLQFSLARYVDVASGQPRYLAVRRSGKHKLASRIDRHMAQELFIHLKNESANPITVVFKRIDDFHSKVCLPVSILPSQISATIDVLSWPIGDVSADGNRIFRTETVKTVKELLLLHGIKALQG